MHNLVIPPKPARSPLEESCAPTSTEPAFPSRWLFAGHLGLANAATLTGLSASIAACALSLRGMLGPALVALVAAGVLDLFDGAIARRNQRSDDAARFGAQLDSLVDMASFGLTPIVIALSLGFNSAADLVLMVAYGCAAAMRLAHFNTFTAEAGVRVRSYTGLPVTFSALFFPLAYIARDLSSPAVGDLIIHLVFALVATAFVARFRCPKPQGVFYVLLSALAVSVSLYLLTGFGS